MCERWLLRLLGFVFILGFAAYAADAMVWHQTSRNMVQNIFTGEKMQQSCTRDWVCTRRPLE